MPSDRSITEAIKDRCNIVDVIGRSVQLRKTGANHKGLCPFHNEKTPSFVVSEARQNFVCYGCGAKGDVIEFVQRQYNLDFRDAIDKLASEYGIDTREFGFAGEGRNTKLYELNREAATFFFRRFAAAPNPGAAYMEKRRLSADVLRRFGIGYADDKWQSLTEHLLAKGAEPRRLAELGLVGGDQNRYYDKFRHRVMFPIINTRGKVVGFGGRAIGDDQPKYLNSSESVIFQKKNQLYGLNLTRQEINRENCAILVEGYMDAISLYQFGVRNVVATLGTALTENQAAMIRRYTDTVVLAYDADGAGQAAALRGMDVLYQAGCRVRVLMIDEGKDPDDYVRAHGKEAFLKLVGEAQPFVEYKLDRLRAAHDLETTTDRVDFLKQAATVLKAIGPIEADAHIIGLARQTGISEGAIRTEVFGMEGRARPPDATRRTRGDARSERTRSRTPGDCLPVERDLIRLMLADDRFIERLAGERNAFSTDTGQRLYEMIRALRRPGGVIDRKSLADNLTDDENRALERITVTPILEKDTERIFQDCLKYIREIGTARREAEIIQILSVLDDEKDEATIRVLTEELMHIQEEKREPRERNHL